MVTEVPKRKKLKERLEHVKNGIIILSDRINDLNYTLNNSRTMPNDTRGKTRRRHLEENLEVSKRLLDIYQANENNLTKELRLLSE